MTADYGTVLRRLGALGRLGVRPGLEATAEALARVGHPERAVRAVHIAGSNGKGSTAAMTDAILRAAGRRVGLYTSPHLVRLTERIRIDGREIAPERAAAIGARVLNVGAQLDAPLTFFEAVTVMGFLAFAEAGVDVAVLEVGLGGRLDATNLCDPYVCVVTGIALEHTELLGGTIAAIAGEKAGIIKAGVPVVVGAVEADAEAVIAARADSLGAPRFAWGRDVMGSLDESGRLDYTGPGGLLAGAALALAGPHQARNAALALAATALLPAALRPDAAARRSGLASVTWPGRLERLAGDLWLDAAHNPDGAQALAAAMDAARARSSVPAAPGMADIHRPVLLLGVLADKDVAAIARHLAPRSRAVVCTTPSSPRALGATALSGAVRAAAPTVAVEAIDDPAAALARARELARASGAAVLGCGSLYLIGALRRLVTGEPSDPLAVADPMPRP